jgi:hypothetical protein
MKKKILFGGIFVLALLLLMPSIPPIQINTIKEAVQQNVYELKTKTGMIDIEKLQELPNHILLFLIIFTITKFRFTRFKLNFLYSISPPFIQIIHPLLLMRSIFLLIRYSFWIDIWIKVSEKLGWNWAEWLV